jgi:hypothetical protein
MSKKRPNGKNLPAVSKQTAGGITGAVIGGMLGGPVGAVAGGVAGALVGTSSARGEKPIKTAVESIRSTLRTPKGSKMATNRNAASSAAKKVKAKIGSAAKKSVALAKKTAAGGKKASKPKTKRPAKRAKKKTK